MAVSLVSTGVQFPDSSIQTTAATAGIPGYFGQVFTSNGTFTIPTGVTAVKVTLVGGGGGGAGSLGAGGGATAISYLSSLTPGATIAVTIGAGGTGGGSGGNSTIASGTQSITTVTAGGGGGGGGSQAGGTATNGSINISGGTGGNSGTNPGASRGGLSLFSPYNLTQTPAAGGRGAGGGDVGIAGTAGIAIFEW